jgi:hypothetical protein
MLELLGRVIGGLVPSVIKSVANRSRLKIICGWGHEVNGDGVGNFLALWVKIINPTSTSVYFERLEAIDQSGEVFFPSLYRIKAGDEIQPQRNIVGIIPCGHVTYKCRPKELHIYDSTERKYVINRRMLRKVVGELEAERARLEGLNMSVHPTHPRPE